MSSTNWYACDSIRSLPYGTECRLAVGILTHSLGYPRVPTSCVTEQPEWCDGGDADPTTFACNPDVFNDWTLTWETCTEYQYAAVGSSATPIHQCRFEKTVLDLKYSSGTYCPYGNDSRGQTDPTYIMGLFLIIWAVYAMLFFGNSRR